MKLKTLWEKYKSVILYVFFGGVTTLVNIVLYALCYKVFGLPNIPSNIIAWIVSVAVAYITNKLWVFESKSFAPEILWPEVGKFVGARLSTGLLDLAIMFVGVDVLHGPELILKIGSNVLVIVLNYILSKLVIFKDRKDTRQ